MRGLRGKAALVTGAATGIGAAIVERLLSEGVDVIAADLKAASWDAQASGSSGNLVRIALDVSRQEDWVRAVDQLEDGNAALNFLVNNAGIASPANLDDETMQDWRSVVQVGQLGTWLGMKHAGGLISRSGGGAIVNVGSIFGAVGGFGTHFAYHGVKGAVSSMSRNAALHFADRQIRVNTVSPGFIDTPASRSRDSRQVMRQRMIEGAPMRRMGSASEVAGAVAFLLSNDASFITGTELLVDGGWTAQ